MTTETLLGKKLRINNPSTADIDEIFFYIRIVVAAIGWVMILQINASSQEFALVPSTPGRLSLDGYFDKLGLPSVELQTECTKNKKRCWEIVINHRDNKLMRFGDDEFVRVIARGRYRNRATLLLSRSRKQGDSYITEHFVIDDSGSRIPYVDNSAPVGDPVLTRDGKLLAVESDRIAIYNALGNLERLIDVPATPVKYANISANPDGKIGIIAISDPGGKVFICGLDANCIVLSTRLTAHGDRRGILSVYPYSNSQVYFAIYRYVNIYNKGIYVGRVDFESLNINIGILFNSQLRNVGFDLELYVSDQAVVVSSRDSTNLTDVHFLIGKQQVDEIELRVPKHTIGFENEDFISLMIGFGTAYNYWDANSKVKKNGITYASVSYEFSNSLSEFVEFEGRIGDNRLALTYLRQEVADDQGRAGEALNLLFDVNNLFAPQWGLRVTRESGVIRGNAMYRDSGQATFSDPQSIDTAFSSRYLRMAADVTMERGFYFGLQYSRYNLPSAIGFSDSSGTVLYTTFEENLEIEKYTFRGGYDHIAYLRRYETEYSGLLYSGRAGIGLANLHISNSVKNEATTNTEKNKIEPLTTSAFDLGGEFGYVFLYRSKFLRGGGVILAAGYRVEASVFRSSRSGDAEQQDGDQDKLFLEFSRSDVIHGPFAKIAAVF